MLLCYLIPALLLGVFAQTMLIKSMRQKTDAALTAGVEHAWTLTAQNVERAIALSRDAICDGELEEAIRTMVARMDVMPLHAAPAEDTAAGNFIVRTSPISPRASKNRGLHPRGIPQRGLRIGGFPPKEQG